MSSFRRPSHLLLFHHSLTDHVIHRRFHKRRADHLAVSSPLAEIRDELLIIADVSLEFSESLCHLSGHVSWSLREFQLHAYSLQSLQRLEGVAMPEIVFDAGYLFSHFFAQFRLFGFKTLYLLQ